jgi:V8-like Glu-specific endopeptidase
MRALLFALPLLLAANLLGSPDSDKPDTSHILRTIGRYGMAHACPVLPQVAVTAAHVIAPNQNDPSFITRLRFDAPDGVTGLVVPAATSDASDLAIVQLSKPAHPYPLATAAPSPGETLYWLAYDYSGRKRALRPEVYSGKVLRVIAGNITIDETTPSGSSGSCVLNGRGEVVGIVSWGVGVGQTDQVTLAVGVFPPWFTPDDFASHQPQ